MLDIVSLHNINMKYMTSLSIVSDLCALRVSFCKTF